MKKYDEIINNINILLADDDEDYLMMTYVFLKQIGYNVDKVTDGKQALEKLKTNNYQIALLDYFMPELNGEEVVTKIRETNKEIIIILQTGFSGQKPPIETMKNLNIQNYYDKTEGIDKLNLEIISAVKIFEQQNEIELAKYKTMAIGKLVSGIAQDVKENLLGVGAGLELTNMVIQDLSENMQKEKIERLNKYYRSNKESLEKIDRVLAMVMNQFTENTDYVILDKDVIEMINVILSDDSKKTGVNLEIKSSLKTNSYISGGINDSVFIMCEIIKEIMYLEDKPENIVLSIAEDESKWYFKIITDKINNMSCSKCYLLKKIIVSVKNANIEKEDGVIVLTIDK